MSAVANLEPRAKRTHARRSCELCKIRKTRCELPDLEVPPSSDPLPADKSCHRCRVLALPCVVDDSARKGRKRQRDEAAPLPHSESIPATLAQASSSSTPLSGSPKRRSATRRPRASSPGAARRPSAINPNLEIMHSFEPLSPEDKASNTRSSRPRPPPDSAERSLKFHGRPLELASTMLQAAYGMGNFTPRPFRYSGHIDLDALVSAPMRARLEHGMTQVQILHPYIPSIAGLFERLEMVPSLVTNLQLALAVYLAALSLPIDPAVKALRDALTPFIMSLRESLMLQAPLGFQTLNCLEMLSVHAPFGVLPLQNAHPASLSVARGQIILLKYIWDSLRFTHQMEHFFSLGPTTTFPMTDTWLWLSLVTAECGSFLEEEKTRTVPDTLILARNIADSFIHPESAGLWRDTLANEDTYRFVGRLAMCDRVCRLHEVLQSLARIRDALTRACDDPDFDPVAAITDEFKQSGERLSLIDERHDQLLRMLSDSARPLAAGWTTYRSLRRPYDSIKIYVTGLRALTATAFLPGYSQSFPNLPTGIQAASTKVSYALTRAANPKDSMAFIMRPSPAAQALWQWGIQRGEIAEQILVAFSSINQNLVPTAERLGDIVPLHEVISIAVDCAKVLMEMQAGSILIHRQSNTIHKAFKVPQWVFSMRKVSQVMADIGGLSLEDGDDAHGDDDPQSLASGCSSLVESMIRIADGWTQALESEVAIAVASQSAPDLASVPAECRQPEHPLHFLQPPYEHQMYPPHTEGNGAQQEQSHVQMNGTGYPHPPSQQPPQAAQQAQAMQPDSRGGAPQQQYMDTSDRWMASTHSPFEMDPALRHAVPQSHPRPEAQPGAPMQQTGYNHMSPVDQLLTDMFSYTYPYPNHPQQPMAGGQPPPTQESHIPPQNGHVLRVPEPLDASNNSAIGWPQPHSMGNGQ